jgi:uncharacterized protein (DUF1499 family)
MNKPIPLVLISLIMVTGCSGSKPNLGVNNGRLTACPDTPNCVNSQAADEKHYIQAIRFPGTQPEVKGRLLKVLASEKRTKMVKIQDHYIRAAFTSALFRFVDDVEFYFPEIQGGETIIHVRSASRVGYFDFGVNRKRIERIRSKMNGQK